jgi:hypothetical protein
MTGSVAIGQLALPATCALTFAGVASVAHPQNDGDLDGFTPARGAPQRQ